MKRRKLKKLAEAAYYISVFMANSGLDLRSGLEFNGPAFSVVSRDEYYNRILSVVKNYSGETVMVTDYRIEYSLWTKKPILKGISMLVYVPGDWEEEFFPTADIAKEHRKRMQK